MPEIDDADYDPAVEAEHRAWIRFIAALELPAGQLVALLKHRMAVASESRASLKTVLRAAASRR